MVRSKLNPPSRSMLPPFQRWLASGDKSDKPTIEERIDAMERRLAALEKDSHPPVNLRPAIQEEVLRVLEERLSDG